MARKKKTKKAFSKAKLGTGARFKACVRKVKAFYRKKGKKVDAEKVCAKIGRKAYGKKKFTQLSIKGRIRKKAHPGRGYISAKRRRKK